MDGFLFQATIFLGSALIAVPIAKKLGLGSVLGYLIAGIVIGPIMQLGLDTQNLQHFAEFGVVMMLFLVGLELEPRALWDMRARLLGLGGLQVGITTLLVMAVALAFGQPWTVALAIGLVLALSSTAIVLQTLNEKGLMKSDGGEASFSVLLFQDIAVIPMLALIPLLAMPDMAAEMVELGQNGDAHATDHGSDHDDGHGDGHGGGHGPSMSLVDGLPGWQVTLITIGAIAGVILGGHYLSRPLFRFIAASKLREIFTAAALFLVIGIALLMTLVGLSPALGTFLAGVVLANSEYRHELESDIEPFKGLLLGLFFITVGAGIDFRILFDSIGLVVGLTLGLMALKAMVLLFLAVVFKIRGSDRYLFSLSLAQAGEFGFVLLAFTVQNAVIPKALSETLLLVVALSMLLTPLMFILFDRVILPRMDREQGREADEITDRGTAIIAGLGRFGQIVNRVLLHAGHKTVVLDHRSDLIEGFRKFGIRSFFGDASRPDLLHSAGLAEAKLLVVAIDDKAQTLEIVKHARRENPDLHIIARAADRNEVYRLYRAGANDIIREVFDSSVRAARSALEAYGMHPYEAEKSVTTFVAQDKRGIRKLAGLWRDDVPNFENHAYMEAARAFNAEIEAAMTGDRSEMHDKTERGWTPPDPQARASK